MSNEKEKYKKRQLAIETINKQRTAQQAIDFLLLKVSGLEARISTLEKKGK